MQRLLSRINNLLSDIAGWLMLIMMGILVADILWRTFARPLLGMAEMSVFVMMIVIYLGFARCEEHDEHVRLEFLVNAAPRHLRRAMILATRLLALVTVALLSYAVTRDAWSSFLTNDSIEGMVNLPIWPTKFVMVAGAAVFFLQILVNVFRPMDRGPERSPDDATKSGVSGHA